MRRNLAILRLFTVLAVVTFVAAATGIWHSHTDVTNKACQVCHVAHLPALEAAPAAGVQPRLITGFRIFSEEFFVHGAPTVAPSSPRAPPAQL